MGQYGKANFIMYKAWLLAKRLAETLKDDFSKVFYPVSTYAEGQFMMTISVYCDWKTMFTDVRNSIIDLKLFKEIYVAQPKGFETKTTPLLRVLYKQSSLWILPDFAKVYCLFLEILG